MCVCVCVYVCTYMNTSIRLISGRPHPITDLLHCTFEPNVSIPQLANLLIERTQNSSWVVVFKSLITVHHLMCYGNEVGVGLGRVRWVWTWRE